MYKVVRGPKSPWLLLAGPVDAPLNIRHCVLPSLADELARLKLCSDEALPLVEPAEFDHVFCHSLPLGPMGVVAVLRDSRRLSVKLGHRSSVQCVERVAVAFKEGSDLGRHGVRCWVVDGDLKRCVCAA